MKKYLALVLGMLLVLAMAAVPAAAEQTTLLVWDTFTEDAMRDGIEEINKMFMEAHPDIKVERVAKDLDAMDQTLKAAFMSGDAPDVIYHEMGIGEMGSYVKAGYLKNLSDAYAKYGWNDTILSVSKEVPSVGDFVYGVGNEIESMGLYYNKAIFDELGLAAPTTVEELTEDFAKIKEAGYIPLANLLDSGWYNNMNFMGTVLYAFMQDSEIDAVMNEDASWDLPSVRACVSTVIDWLDKGYFPDHPEVDGDQEAMFVGQEAACWVTGNWSIAQVEKLADFDAKIIPFPGSSTNSDGGSQVNFTGSGFMTSNVGSHQEQALEYINFALNNADTAKVWYEVCKVIPPYTGKVDAEISPLLKQVQDSLGNTDVKNVAGINMWLASYGFDFFSICGQKLAIKALDVDSFIAELDAAVQTDVANKSTKATFSFD